MTKTPTTLPQLLHGLVPDEALPDLQVHGVQEDSRAVCPKDLFVAQQGLTVDGHGFAAKAAEAGAVAVVGSRPVEGLSIPCFVVEDPARVLALAAARLHGSPAEKLRLLGITGTNGKTTTTYLMEAILAGAGRRPGVVGTVGYRWAGNEQAAPFTTPTPLLLQPVLAQMVDAGCSDAVLEVSSHALELGRVWGLDFAVAAFTHLTQDHLDLHGSMDAYLRAKLLLFSRHLLPGGTAVVNVDGAGADEVMQTVLARGDVELVRCSTTGAEAEAALLDMCCDIDGIRATLRLGQRELPVRSSMLGAYNGDNLLMAATCCHAAGVSLEQLARGVEQVQGVPGRLERVDGGRGFAILVDYAHTPDALARAVGVLRPLCRGRLIVVFGCGGDRDQTKRPLMGEAVARAADLAVVTSDNPRTEQPGAIIEMILRGVEPVGIPRVASLDHEHGYWVEADRREAIFAAVRAARPGDIVLIAGKGHEDYQILGTTKIHFDDREQAREALGDRP